jgi:RimJ/RimL family protein N-acetyltransferase
MEYDIFRKGEDISLVAINESIINNTDYYKWYNDEEVTYHLEHGLYPNTKELQLEYYKNNILNQTNKCQFGIIHNDSQEFIGVISLNDIDFINKNCMIAIIFGKKKYKSLNRFIESNLLIMRHAFFKFGMNKVYISTLSEDISKMYCKVFKFKEDAILRKHLFVNGEYKDLFIASLLKSEYDGDDYK